MKLTYFTEGLRYLRKGGGNAAKKEQGGQWLSVEVSG